MEFLRTIRAILFVAMGLSSFGVLGTARIRAILGGDGRET